MANDKIFIDRTPDGDFLMRMPAEAIADFYEMITASPLLPRRWFYQVKVQMKSSVVICTSTRLLMTRKCTRN